MRILSLQRVFFHCLLFTTTFTKQLRGLSVLAMDPEGFDPVQDTVGAGIYSGKVLRDEQGNVVYGKQYQNHNPQPGPVYSGGGFTDMANAIHNGPDSVRELLQQQPGLANEISTGGATPLHTCGMSRRGQLSTQILIEVGGAIEAIDTYGYTPLHRMASNNLAIGAEALLKAGADVNKKSEKPYSGQTPLRVAYESRASDVAEVLKRYGGKM